ncbi:MAG: cytochrome c biogenesis protein CcsA, partial [Candidatus Eremiobacteraeota bacterium]|nr:cytochrome c biogenesis protein CcsA [Candidatus Eremiobacteraeota bacterium]
LYLVRYYVERRQGAAMMLSASIEPGGAGAAAGTATIAGPNDGISGWLASLPTLPQLDVLVYRSVAVGLPLLTLGIITGAMWAKEAWGAYWQWDPKETAALFSWIIYAAYMHLHTRNQWRGMRTSWVSVIGFISIIFCYLGVNIWISGLHSYKV